MYTIRDTPILNIFLFSRIMNIFSSYLPNYLQYLPQHLSIPNINWIPNLKKYIELPQINPEYNYIYQGSFTDVFMTFLRTFFDFFTGLFTHVYPIHIFVFVVLMFVAIFMYIKLKYPFWNLQPVYHKYAFWYKFSNPHIYSLIPNKTKYYDKLKIIQTTSFENVSRETIKTLCEFMQSHYIQYDGIFWSITEKDMISYLSGQKAFVSIWYEFENPIGFITSRTIDFHIADSNITNTDAYYFDMICLIKKHEDKIHTLFQTHEYNQRILEPGVPIGLFKKEIQILDSVVPLVQYKSISYYLRNLKIPKLPATDYYLLRVMKTHPDILHTICTNQLKKWFPHLVVCPSMSAIIGLLKSNQLFVYVLKRGENILAYYFLKNANMVYDMIDGATIQLVGSILANQACSLETFYFGFLHSVQLLLKDQLFKMIIIDGISDNLYILDKWNRENTGINDVDTAYYMYNYIYPGSPIDSSKCLVLL